MQFKQFMDIVSQVFTKKQLQQMNESMLQNLPNNGGKPERKRVFTLNEHMRSLPRLNGVPDDWGYVALNIPYDDMRIINLRYPDTASPDAQIQHAAWKKFLASPESEIYKVRKRDGKRGMLHQGTLIK